jgi:hypothetical protein
MHIKVEIDTQLSSQDQFLVGSQLYPTSHKDRKPLFSKQSQLSSTLLHIDEQESYNHNVIDD